MTECTFCAGEKIRISGIGPGTKTMKFMLDYMFGTDDDEDYDGIRLVKGNRLAFDNSAGEYAEMMVDINYCPFCGTKLKGELSE